MKLHPLLHDLLAVVRLRRWAREGYGVTLCFHEATAPYPGWLCTLAEPYHPVPQPEVWLGDAKLCDAVTVGLHKVHGARSIAAAVAGAEASALAARAAADRNAADIRALLAA